MTSLKKRPSLRFPQFNHDWETAFLGDIATFSKGKGISKSEISENGQYECIRYGELYTQYNERIFEAVSKTNIDNRELIFSQYNDVIIPASGETQLDIATAACVLKSNIALGGDINIIKSDLDGVFLAYYLKNFKKREIARLSQGVSVVHLYSSQLKTLKINIPSKNEQNKISDFLAAVDEKAERLARKKALLEVYKKGLLQKFFNQEIRFKDQSGNDFPRWNEKKFGEVFIFINTNSYPRSLLNYEKGSIKNIHYGDIHTKFKTNFDIRKEEVPFLNIENHFDKVHNDCYLQEGDLVIADASEDYKDVGKSIEIINLDNQNAVAGLHTYIARDLNNIMALGFKGYLMQDYFIRLQIMKMATGSSVLGITKGNLAKISIKIPCLEEQKKITNFLMNIDVKIEIMTRELEKTQIFKKGLQQRMFI